jgi:DNA (cytosine-5)-methyltransferase 1
VKGATIFSGGELAGVGMRAAGIEHVWGIEIDDNVAGLARANGFNVITADILTVDPAQMEPVEALHMSPVCTRASRANQSAELNEDGTKEAPLDIAMGEKAAQFIDVLKPRVVTLENVWFYRNFKAFKIICAVLSRGGYMWDFEHLNAANFAVPQTRQRLILRAVRGALLPMLPAPVEWVGWFSAVEDLIPTLPTGKFPKWIETRLPDDLIRMMSFVTSNAKTEYGDGLRWQNEPVHTVTQESNGRTRAFIVDGQDAGAPGKHGERGLTIRDGQEPMFTISASMWPRRPARAWLQSGRVVSLTPRALARSRAPR